MKEQRGETITVLAILSWIYMGISFLFALAGFMNGPETAEGLEAARIQMLEGQDPEVVKMMGWFFEEMYTFTKIANDNFYLLNSISLLNLIIGFFGVFFMFNLAKKGFYLYLTYSIVPLAVATFFYSGMTIGTFIMTFHVVIGLLFVLLYAGQLKKMS
jgi:hypothetical protein